MTELQVMIEKELAKHPVKYAFGRRGKHPIVTIKKADKSRYVVFTSTQTDRRGKLNCISMVRRTARMVAEA